LAQKTLNEKISLLSQSPGKLKTSFISLIPRVELSFGDGDLTNLVLAMLEWREDERKVGWSLPSGIFQEVTEKDFEANINRLCEMKANTTVICEDTPRGNWSGVVDMVRLASLSRNSSRGFGSFEIGK
jgi:hypothetical protein